MRRSFIGLAVIAIAMLTPLVVQAGDRETAQQIAASLKASGRLAHYSIGVKVHEGVVWLNGTVTSQEQLSAALDVVQQTPGIEKIINGVTIAEPTAAAPAIQAEIAAPIAQPAPPPTASAGRNAAAMHPAIGGAIQQTSGQTTDPTAQLAMNAQQEQAEPSPSVLNGRGSGAPRPLMPSRMAGQIQPMPAQAGGPPMQGAPMMQGGPPMQGAPMMQGPNGTPIPAYAPGMGGGVAPAHFDRPNMPGYSWPSYAAYPNYAALTYPKQYSPTAWPFIGPFYPYPQVPLGWRKVSLEWHNGWWMLDFKDSCNDTY